MAVPFFRPLCTALDSDDLIETLDDAANKRYSLGCNSQARAQKLGSEIRAIWPNEGAQLWMNRELSKHFNISQRLEHRAVQLTGEINLTFCPIAEPEPNRVAGDVTSLNEVR